VGAAYEDGAMRLLDAASGRAIVEIAAHRGAATCVAFAPSGLYAATGGADGAVRLWDLRQQACVCEVRPSHHPLFPPHRDWTCIGMIEKAGPPPRAR